MMSTGSSISWRSRRSRTWLRCAVRIACSRARGSSSWRARPTRGCARSFAPPGSRGSPSTRGAWASSSRRASTPSGAWATRCAASSSSCPRIDHEANAIARELEELNRHRQDVDRKTLARARELINALDLDATHGIVLAEDGWHPGVIGIVASRLIEEHGRPVLLIALDGDEGKGSGRSISAFDLHAALAECRDLLVRFGGHRAAAGVTVARANIPELARRFNEIALAQLTVDDLVAELRVDLELPISAVTFELEALLRHFEPFGPSNPTPVIVSRGVRLAGPARVMGDGHLKLRLATAAGELEAIGWGMASLAGELDLSIPFDIAYRLERDDWNGAPRLQLKIAAVQH